MPNMYTLDGWANTDLFFSDPAPIVIAFGGRGIGKTYGVLKHLLQEQIPFLYMRRTQKNIEMLELDAMNPFQPLNRDLGRGISMFKAGKFFYGFYEAQTDEKTGKRHASGPMIAPAVSLSSFCRGIDGVEYDVLVYDEFIPQKIDKKMRGEGDAFLNAVESIQRNRAIQGRPQLKCILLSNTLSSINNKKTHVCSFNRHMSSQYAEFLNSVLNLALTSDTCGINKIVFAVLVFVSCVDSITGSSCH